MIMYREEKPSMFKIAMSVSVVLWSFIGIVCLGMYGCPRYKVYEQDLEGQAELARATANRKIAIQEAEAKKEAATSLAQAEIERAKGVAKANEIIGESLKSNEAYLRWLWIEGLKTNDQQVVYIPTEAGLPILETNRLNKVNK